MVKFTRPRLVVPGAPKPAAAGAPKLPAERAPKGAIEVGKIAKAADAAVKQIAARARADIELIKQRVRDMVSNFYDIAEALARLKRPEASRALGYSGFRELVEKELGISGAKADELVKIATNVSREVAESLGHKGALSLVSLARATPEHDTPDQIAKGAVKLPDGKVVDVKRASAREIERAAKAIRAAHGRKKSSRGRTTTPDEVKAAAELQKRLRKAGLARAEVSALATGPGRGADLRIEGVPVAELSGLCGALCGKSGGSGKR